MITNERLTELIRWTDSQGMPDTYDALQELSQSRRLALGAEDREALENLRHWLSTNHEAHAAVRALDKVLDSQAGPERDACRFCLGHKGGTPGNENVMPGGIVVCDHCHVLLDSILREDM